MRLQIAAFTNKSVTTCLGRRTLMWLNVRRYILESVMCKEVMMSVYGKIWSALWLACWTANREVWGLKSLPGQKFGSRVLLHLHP